MLGEISALTASAFWATASLLFSRLRSSISATSLNLLKCFIALVLMLVTRALLHGGSLDIVMASDEVLWLTVSGLFGLTLGDTLMFLSLSRIGPRRTLLMTSLTPLMTALMAAPALGESLGSLAWLGMAITMIGVTAVVRERAPKAAVQATTLTASTATNASDGAQDATLLTRGPAPRLGEATAGYLFALGAAFCQAAGNVMTKLGGEHEALDLAIVRLIAGTAGLLVLVLIRREFGATLRPLTHLSTARWVVIATLLGTYLGIWLQVTGLRYATAGVAATLSSTSPIFVLPLAHYFLKEHISPRSIWGAILAVGGIALLFVRA